MVKLFFSLLFCFVSIAHADDNYRQLAEPNHILCSGALSKCLDAAGVGTTIEISEVLPPLTANAVVTSGVELSFKGLGLIACGSSTLTIRSSTANWPGRQIFANCVGKVNGLETERPIWFGQGGTGTWNFMSQVAIPSGWSGTLPFTIVSKYNPKPGDFGLGGSWSISAFKPWSGTGKTYYVNGATGNNANSGLTAELALRDISAALAKADADIIYVAAGYYPRVQANGLGKGWGGTSLQRSLSVIATGGTVISSTAQPDLLWSLTGGQTYVWQATLTNVFDVLDPTSLDVDGDYNRLTKVGSIAAVDAAQNSWYTDGAVVYVRLTADRTPTSLPTSTTAPRVLVNEANGSVLGNQTVYLENIIFEGGTDGLLLTAASSVSYPRFYGKNVEMKYANNNNLTLRGGYSFCEQCVAAKAYRDGFNYHIINSAPTLALEVNCIGRNNGWAGDNINNGSTSHDGSTMVRLNGRYYGNNGPNVIDVNDGGQSWNLGTTAYNSTGSGSSKVDYSNQGLHKMWLDSVNWAPSTSTYAFWVQASANIYIHNATLPGNRINDSSYLQY